MDKIIFVTSNPKKAELVTAALRLTLLAENCQGHW